MDFNELWKLLKNSEITEDTGGGQIRSYVAEYRPANAWNRPDNIVLYNEKAATPSDYAAYTLSRIDNELTKILNNHIVVKFTKSHSVTLRIKPLLKNRTQEEMAEEYLINMGFKCPCCSSDNIEGGALDADNVESNCIVIPVECNECGAKWNDIYTLTGCEDIKQQYKR